MKPGFVYKYILIFSIIFLFVGCAIFGGKERPQIPYDEVSFYEQEGDRYLTDGDYSKAIESYSQAVKKDPKSTQIRRKLGEAYAKDGKNDLALNEFNEILKTEPNNIHAHNFIGFIYINQEEWLSAIKQFEKTLSIDPNNLYALNHIGLSYKMLGNTESAKTYLQKASELDPEMNDPESKNTHNFLGLIYKEEKNHTQAIAEYKKTLERFPADVEAHNRLGEIYELQGDYQSAITEYNTVLAINPDNEFARSRLQAFQESGIATYEVKPVEIVKDDIEQLITNAPSAEEYPNASAIILLDKLSYELLETGRLRYTIHLLIKIIDEIGIAEYGEIAVPFNSRYQNIGVNLARTILPDGTEIHAALDAYHDITLPELSAYNMYSDIMLKVVSMPSLQPGVIIEYKATLEDAEDVTEKPWVWGSMNFQSSEPILNAKCIIRTPKDFKIKWKLHNCQIEPVITEDEKSLTYIWISKNNPSLPTELAMPPLEDVIPSLFFTSTESWDEVYQWYKEIALPQEKFDSIQIFSISKDYENELNDNYLSESLKQEFANNNIQLSENAELTVEEEDTKWLITDTNKIYSIRKDEDMFNVHDEIVMQKVRELTQGKETLDEKIKAIYEFVASEIRYVAIELGQGAYQPYAASEVFKYRYGDCKDKTTLLSAMLRHIGVNAYQALINPYPGKLIDLDIPSIAQFSHVITAIPLEDGGYIWLDPTVSTCKYGDLPAGDQGRKAFVIGEDKGEFVDTPLFPSEYNKMDLTSEINILEDGSIHGWERIIAKGQSDIYLRAVYRLTKSDKIKEYFESAYNTRYPGVKIDGLTISDLYNMDKPLEISVDFSCPKYAYDHGEVIVFSLPSEDYSSFAALVGNSADRLYDFHLTYNMSTERNLTLNFPAGYEVAYLPDNLSANFDFGSFVRKYENNGKSSIKYHTKMDFNNNVIPSKSYANLKQLIDTAAKEDKSYIILRKTNK